MPLYYVTGLSGSGKSSVLRELRTRGYHARGVDEDGYADWINRISGRADAFPRGEQDFDFHAWYAAHYWVLSVRRISRLSRAAARLGKPVFLCGSASGDDVVWQLFDKVIALVANERTIRQRLAARPGGFGTTPEELADVLFWHAGFETAYRGFGATIIDATMPLPDVVAEVLDAVTRRPSPRAVTQGRHPGPLATKPLARKPRTSSAITAGYSSGA